MQGMKRKAGAKRLAVSLRTLDRLLAGGQLPFVRVGRAVVILESDLLALARRGRTRGRP